eukprot:Phypoly_transcript_09186.p2 GENE.Phypoly_transcript_09186~~Phypoly_transcript_09186.p2  ORF type:complete len:110 (+),score=20.12 Phypoly_transcript_09186:952-1281(+)
MISANFKLSAKYTSKDTYTPIHDSPLFANTPPLFSIKSTPLQDIPQQTNMPPPSPIDSYKPHCRPAPKLVSMRVELGAMKEEVAKLKVDIGKLEGIEGIGEIIGKKRID